jgi:hypothetical protein
MDEVVGDEVVSIVRPEVVLELFEAAPPGLRRETRW